MANISFNTVALFNAAKSTLAGDSGADTLGLGYDTLGSPPTAVVFNDSTLGGMNAATVDGATKFEVLSLSDVPGNQVTLGGNASLSGFQAVFGGASADRIIVSS